MKNYKVCFGFGRNSTFFFVEFVHSEKHDSEDDFEKDLNDFASKLNATYLYKTLIE